MTSVLTPAGDVVPIGPSGPSAATFTSGGGIGARSGSALTGQSAGWVSLAARADGSTPTVRFDRIARENPWVRQAVNRRARSAARVPIHVRVPAESGRGRQRVRPGDRSPAAGLAELLEHPSPGVSAMRLRRKVYGDVHVHGNGLLEKVKRASRVVELRWHPWIDVHVVMTEDGLGVEAIAVPTERSIGTDARVLSVGPGRWRWLSPDDVIIVNHGEDTAGPLGVSPIESLRFTHRLHDAVNRFVASILDESVVPSGFWGLDASVTPEQARLTREFLEDLHAGVDQAGKPMVGWGKWQSFVPDAAASKIVELAEKSRAEVAAAYDLPTSQQNSENANRASSQVDRETWIRDVVGADVGMFEAELQAQLVRPSPAWRAADAHVEAQLAEQLRPDMVALSSVIVRQVGGPMMTPNEGRKLVGLDPLDDEEADHLILAPGTPDPARDGAASSGDGA